jgi:ABC-2 type transport system permease protein
MPLLRALLYLRLMMLRNLVLGFVHRLRQPRYLLGLAIALGYFWLVLFKRLPRSPNAPPAPSGDSSQWLLATMVTVVAMVIWLLPGDKPNMRFTEAEVAFLFPAPMKRSQLIHYKLLTGLLSSLLGAVFFTLMATRFSSGPGESLRFLGAGWLLLNLFTLHDAGASFTLVRLGTGKVIVWLRRTVVGALIVLFVLLAGYLNAHQQDDVLHKLLAPARFLLQPFFVAGLSYVQAMAGLVLLFAVHYWWVLRMETPFEEASMALAAKRADMLAKMRAGKGLRIAGKAKAKREPYALRPSLPVELVLLWKNLMVLPAYLNRRVFFVSALAIVLGLRWLRQEGGYAGQGAAGTLGVMSLVMMGYMLLFIPSVVRNDLRGDLAQADLLKAWPLPGWRIVMGSMLAPVVVMTAFSWLFLLTAFSGIQVEGKLTPWLTLPLKISMAVSLALYMPAFSALLLIGPNAVAVYFPAWSQVGGSTQRGFDAMGLRLVLMFGQLLLLLVALLPTTLFAALVFYLSQWFTSQAVGLVLATLAALVVLVLEILFAIHLLGERFEQLDIAAELRQ